MRLARGTSLRLRTVRGYFARSPRRGLRPTFCWRIQERVRLSGQDKARQECLRDAMVVHLETRQTGDKEELTENDALLPMSLFLRPTTVNASLLTRSSAKFRKKPHEKV